MKLIVMALACISAQAATISFTWDKPAAAVWHLVRVYEKSIDSAGKVTYTRVAEVAGTKLSVDIRNVKPGVHTYVARGVNSTGESIDSGSKTATVPAGK